MVVRDPNTLDLTHQKLRLAEDVMVWPIREQGELVYRLEIPKLHRFFRVGYEEYVFISLLDGQRTIPQACGLAAAKLGSRAATAAQAGSIGRWLLRNELAYLESDGPPVRRVAGSGSAPGSDPNRHWMARSLGRLNPFWIKLPLPKVEGWINRSARYLSPLFDRRLVLLGIVLIVVASIVLATHWNEFASASTRLIHPANWIWLLVTWVALKIVHELAHAVACDRQGASVRESGLVFILFAPLAYVDVTSCWRLNSRWSRIAVAAAGMYVELVLAALAAILWVMVDAPQARFLLHNLIFAAGLSTLLFNANALMRFDGYFILADFVEIPNLYSEASSAVRRLAQRLVTGDKPSPGHLVGWRKHFALVYGLAAALWRVTICVSLGIAASTMFAGAGIAIAMLGIVTWLGRPLTQLLRFARDLQRRDPNRFVRSVVVGTWMAAMIAAMFFWLPVPTSIQVPVVARYIPETTLRSRVSGFVANIHVADGAEVGAGDLLVELENRELSGELRQLEITRRQNEIRLRQAIDRHHAGEILVLRENQKALDQQLEQLRLQTAGLRIIAPRRGRVVARGLDSRLGTYVHEGDPLLIVAAQADKELVAVIPQQDIRQIRPLAGTEVEVRRADQVAILGHFDRIEPRATDQLEEVSLAASEGGTLAVEAVEGEDSEASFRLLEPHFRGRIGLASDVARRIPAGMRMEASFGYRTDPLATRLRQSVRRLWNQAQQSNATSTY